jgi:malate synthase
MGGMAAQIPIRDDPAANQVAMEKVRKDKIREVQAGHDGTWVAHPALVKMAMDIFNQHMLTPNQIHIRRDDVQITQHDLLNTKVKGTISVPAVRLNVSIALQYMEAWLRGFGCVPIHHLMEDAATAEISVSFLIFHVQLFIHYKRSQLWQWVRHRVRTIEGKTVTADLVKQAIDDECASIRNRLGADAYGKTKFERAKDYLWSTVQGKEYAEFLTTQMYDELLAFSLPSKL